MTSPATFPVITELAPNSRVLAVLDRCPLCGKEGVKLQADWAIYEHRSKVTADPCTGPHPEAMFTLALQASGLDARGERSSVTLLGYETVDDAEFAAHRRETARRIDRARTGKTR